MPATAFQDRDVFDGKRSAVVGVKSNGHLKTDRDADGGGMEMVVECVVEEMALSGQWISFEI